MEFKISRPTAEDSVGPMNAKLIDLQNEVVKRVIHSVDYIGEIEADGHDCAEVAHKFMQNLQSLDLTQEFVDWERFARKFSNCLDAGPGCDHNDDEHLALIMVFEMGEL